MITCNNILDMFKPRNRTSISKSIRHNNFATRSYRHITTRQTRNWNKSKRRNKEIKFGGQSKVGAQEIATKIK
jgi:hypothetical protein